MYLQHHNVKFGKTEYEGLRLKDIIYTLDIHDSYEFIYVKDGVCEITCNQKKIKLSAGMGMLVFPNWFHSSHTIGTSEVWNVIFPRHIVQSFDERVNGFVPETDFYYPDFEKVKIIYDNLIEIPCPDEIHLNACVNLICADFLDKNKLINRENDISSDVINDALQYIHKNYMHRITLDDVAENICVNKSYLSKKLNQTDGLGFVGYVKAFRLERALTLICTTDMKISDVATFVGYTDSKQFSIDFKKRFMKTPSEYRKS